VGTISNFDPNPVLDWPFTPKTEPGVNVSLDDIRICSKEFRSQTSNSMNKCKSRGGKSQRGEQNREDQRRERMRRKKMQVREKVGKSRNIVFFR
jgi:hypothetical protein